MTTVKGKWMFNDILTLSNFDESVNFISNNVSYERINISLANSGNAPFTTLNYGTEDNPFLDTVYSFEDYDKYDKIGWYIEPHKTIDFDKTEQAVSDGFYAWLVENAIYVGNIEFNFTENGTTTLATAGKVCRNNIEINVNITKYDDKLVDRSITEFISKTVTKIAQYGLGYKVNLKKVDLWNVTSIEDKAFYNDAKLDTLIIRTPEVCSLAATTTTFNNTKIAKGTGYIYVPHDLVDSYKAATNWSTYSDQIKSINELGE